MTLSPAEIAEFTEFAQRLADAAARITRGYFRQPMTVDHKGEKAEFDPVTAADRQAEAAMRALIRESYPKHAILGEEAGSDGEGPDRWVLDPIDGTRAFISGFPTWGTLIAFARNGQPLIGIMEQPFTGERYLGTPEGAWLGEDALTVRPCDSLAEATLYATTPDMFATSGEKAAFKRLESKVKLRRFGGDCYSYCMLAAGFVDLVVEASMAPYDIQALIPIIEGAGGIVTNWEGRSAAEGGRILAAGNRTIHEAAMAVLRG